MASMIINQLISHLFELGSKAHHNSAVTRARRWRAAGASSRGVAPNAVSAAVDADMQKNIGVEL